MRNTKKFAAMIAALALSACSIAPMFTFAADGDVTASTTITMKEGGETNTSSTFKAYKILNASVAGTAYNYTVNDKYTSIIKTALNLEDTASEMDIVDKISSLNDENMRLFADTVYKAILSASPTIEADATANSGVFDVGQGYYLIAETALGENNTAGTMSLVMVDTKGEEALTVNTKKEVPSFQKKLKDTNDSTGETTDWQDSADYDIGDKVPFQLKATLPSDYDKYDHYKLVFHDDLNKNGENDVFTLDTSSIKVYADINGNGECEENEIITTANLTTELTAHDSFDCDLEVTIPDLKADSLATLNIIKTTPIYVEYEATLNENAALGKPGNWNDAYLEYSNNPYNDGNGDTDTTSKTPVDTVVVFTYKTVIDKVKIENDEVVSLAGAEFKLEKKIKENGTEKWETLTLVTSEDGTSFSFTGLDDGDYRLSEISAPAGYKLISEFITFTVSAEHTENGDKAELELTSLTGEVVDGKINIQNLTDDKNMEVDTNLTTLNTKVINTSGSELPSTGGMGTKLFYLGGGAMVAVAGVFLIAKKRAGKTEN